MNTAVNTLLQVATTLLLAVQGDHRLPPAVQQKMVTIAEQSIQLSTQALAKIDFPVTNNNSIWPTADDVGNAPYIGLDGKYARSGANIQAFDQYTSFGDMNGDGFDDAAVIIKRTNANGNVNFALGAMLNQGNILFNIADVPLGNTAPAIYDHHVVNGQVMLDMQMGNQPRAVSYYELLGNAFRVAKRR
jgi:hypothetical protein